MQKSFLRVIYVFRLSCSLEKYDKIHILESHFPQMSCATASYNVAGY